MLVVFLGVAVLGCAAFALARNFVGLTLARALIGVGVSGLAAPPRQLSLWDAPAVPSPEEQARQQRVQAALAAIQARFGAGALRRASEIGDEPS